MLDSCRFLCDFALSWPTISVCSRGHQVAALVSCPEARHSTGGCKTSKKRARIYIGSVDFDLKVQFGVLFFRALLEVR